MYYAIRRSDIFTFALVHSAVNTMMKMMKWNFDEQSKNVQDVIPLKYRFDTVPLNFEMREEVCLCSFCFLKKKNKKRYSFSEKILMWKSFGSPNRIQIIEEE